MPKTSTTPPVEYSDSKGQTTIGNGFNPAIPVDYEGIVDLPNLLPGSFIIKINNKAFLNCLLTDIVIPDTVESIGEYAFNATHISSLTLGSSLTKILTTCFAYSTIKSIDLSQTQLQEFTGIYHFYHSTLEEISLPPTIKMFSHFCFGYTYIKTIEIPRDMYDIGNCPFGCCQYLNTIVCNSKHFKVYEGVLYTSDYVNLIKYPANGTARILPTVRYFGTSGVFTGCRFQNYTLELQIESFGTRAFRYCRELVKIDLSKSTIQYLPDETFYECNKLQEIIWPEALYSIGNAVFRYCNISVLTIPASVGQVGKNIFEVSNISVIEYLGTLTSLNTNILPMGLKELRVPENYPYSTLFNSENINKALPESFNPRTPWPIATPTPRCFHSVPNCCPAYFRYVGPLNLYVFILM